MKNTIALFRKAYFEDSKIPFKAVTYFNLNQKVKGKGKIEKATGCVHEFTLLMNCLQEHFYDNNLCPSEAQKFRDCFRSYNEQSRKRKEANKSKMAPNSKSYTDDQINKYLMDYSQ